VRKIQGEPFRAERLLKPKREVSVNSFENYWPTAFFPWHIDARFHAILHCHGEVSPEAYSEFEA
jgi:hypothetical protein